MQVKVKFNDINVKEEKEKTLVKILMLKGEKGERGDGDFNVIEDVKVNGTSLPVSGKSVNVEIPTNNSAFNNDSGYLVENDLQMVETTDVENGSQITDATGYGRINYIYGDISQETTTGKNVLNIFNLQTGEKNGITCTFDSTTQEITFNGTCTANNTGFEITNLSIPFTANTTKLVAYYIGGSITGNGKFTTFAPSYQYYDYINISQLNSSNNKMVISSSNTATKTIFKFRFENGTSLSNFKIKIMITDNEDTTFEKFTFGASPNSDYPQPVKVVKGEQILTIGDGTSSTNYTVNLGSLELCSIENYKDYIYENNGNWYKKSYINKVTFNGTETWKTNTSSNKTRFIIPENLRPFVSGNTLVYCNYFIGAKGTNYLFTDGYVSNPSSGAISFYAERFSSLSNWTTWLSSHNLALYHILSTPTDTQITDSTLIEYLNNVKNILLYLGVTNFILTSDNLTPTLNITYAITNRDIYSKEEVNDLFDDMKKDIKNEDDEIKDTINDIKSTMKFHAVAGSQATYVAEFPNGKKLLVDTGMPEQWNAIKTAIDSLGITKFDYFIITHAHYDHISNIQNFINSYDFSDCVCWVGLKPDYVNHSDVIIDDESIYDNMITLLQTNGLNPIVPENDSYYNIDENTKLHFLNTDIDIAENYYNANIIPEYQTNPGVNFNHFSLITEIIYRKDVINLPGDIERINEQYYYPYVHKASFLALPHHGINRDYYKQFYYATMPKFAYGSWVNDNNDWSKYDHRQFNFVKELNTKMITPTNSIPVNGLHTFISNGYSLISTSLSSGLNYPGIEKGRFYSDIDEIINFTIKTHRYVTINDLFNNMNFGDILFTPWLPFFSTHYEQLYNELKLLFPGFDNLLTDKLDIEFRKTKEDIKEIKIYNKKIEYVAQSRGENTAWSLNNGNGIINETIIGIDNLITRLKQLPFGHYTLKNYQDDVGDVLSTSIRYALTFDIFEKWVDGSDNVIIANIYGTMRSTDTPTENDKARAVIGFINTSLQQKYIWFKVN